MSMSSRASRHRRCSRRSFALAPTLALLAAAAALPAARAQNAPSLERVEIIGTAPLPGAGVDRDKLPANVQTLGSARIAEIGATNLPDLMRQAVGSVNVIETQGNPYQLEVNFRGFTASPLLGQSQGLSVFLDGVRVNEAFGDVVNWDLVPRNALASLTMLPGSNPVFGLNTLGGALVLATKSGDTHPGTEVELSVGSFGRKDLEISHGAKIGEETYLFVAADLFKEDGWRDHSPSEVRQVFVKLNQDLGAFDWSLSLNGADNDLIGNGLMPESLLEAGRSQIYTRPDQTRNKLFGVNLRGGYELGDGQRAEALAYVRRLKTRTVNGDLNDEWDGLSDETGVENRTRGNQRGSGLALQWSRRNEGSLLTLGASHDRSKTDFEQTEAEGVLDASRAVTDLEAEELNASLSGRSRTSSLYATSSLALSPALTLTTSGRYNTTRVTTVDVGRTLGLATTLDADQRFHAFNPALGATWAASPELTLYGGVSQGNRAPSPVELGCSDPANPCVLPNALQSDPPLKQVISRTLEAGLRGRLASGWRWNAGVFSTTNRDDILFVSNSRAAGYFANVGKTRRQGLELGTQGRAGAWDLGLSYTRLLATYRSASCVVAEANSSAETSANCVGEGEIEVRPGNRLPGVPKDLLKLELGWRAMPGLRLSAHVQAQSSAYVRGNDNNQHQPDGVDFNGSGSVAGFALLNLQANWKIGSGWSLIGKVNNALDRRYATGGLLAENAFSAGGVLQQPADWRDEQFVAPGAPRSYTLALQWRFND